jgi:hypothetical protein
MGAVKEEDNKKKWGTSWTSRERKDPKKLMELIKQIEAILKARSSGEKGTVASIPPTEEPTDWWWCSFELASLRKNGWHGNRRNIHKMTARCVV